MKKLGIAVVMAALSAALPSSCGSGDTPPPNGLPGTAAPSPSPSASGGGGGSERDWSRVTFAESPCPPPRPGQPACLAAITFWSVDDEGEIRPDSPGPDRVSPEDLRALDARVDAVKGADGLSCEGGPQGGFNQSVAIAFDGGSGGVENEEGDLFYTLDTASGQECHRGAIEDARALRTEMQRLKRKYTCGCFGDVCIDCMEPSPEPSPSP